MCDRSGQRIEKTWSRNKDEYDRMSGSNAGYVDGAVYGGIFSWEIGSFAYGIAGDQRGRISWSRNLSLIHLSGLAIVWMYQRFSSLSLKGMTLVFEVGQKKREEIPVALVPLVMIGTWITHLFGGSAGREGVAAVSYTHLLPK